jgi:hypothetical protein
VSKAFVYPFRQGIKDFSDEAFGVVDVRNQGCDNGKYQHVQTAEYVNVPEASKKGCKKHASGDVVGGSHDS